MKQLTNTVTEMIRTGRVTWLMRIVEFGFEKYMCEIQGTRLLETQCNTSVIGKNM